jgi:S-adenosyl-L-methionine hydrolase (adenosine-forming)
MAVVTFTSDFGLADAYAGAMKGVVLSLAPDAVLVDITHDIPRRDVAAGALALAQAVPFFPSGSVHVAVVDPGVGGERAGLVIEAGGRTFVGPDNGVLSLATRSPRCVYRIENPGFRRDPPSPTFHGRDIFAVTAGRLAGGSSAKDAGPPMPAIVELPGMEDGPLEGECRGRVVHVDAFGNLLTSLGPGRTEGRWQLRHADRHFEVRGGRTFADVAAGELVLYEGSSGRIEIAARDGSAAARTGAQTGAKLELRRLS